MQQQFQVPQFIDLEGKILGPLTIRQTAIMGAGAVVIFLLRMILEQFLWIPVSIVIALAAAALAFIRVSSMPLHKFLAAFAGYVLLPRLYIWRKAGTVKAGEDFGGKEKKTAEKVVPPTEESMRSRLKSYAEKQDASSGGLR